MADATPPPIDLTHFAAAVRLRDRCRVAAMSAHERAGLAPSFGYANSTYDAIADLIREDERSCAGASYRAACLATARKIADAANQPGALPAASYRAAMDIIDEFGGDPR